MITLIAICDNKRGISRNGKIPWRLSLDLKRFKKLTKKNSVLMGRRTWDSLPKNNRPLKDRINIILSKSTQKNNQLLHMKEKKKNVMIYNDLNKFLSEYEKEKNKYGILFVIGGEEIYRLMINLAEEIYLTHVQIESKCDKFFPLIPSFFRLEESSNILEEKGYSLRFLYYKRKRPKIENINGEESYLKILKRILKEGNKRKDRTKIGTKSIFGVNMRFSLLRSFPLLTTKKMFWKGIVHELLWFLNGRTNSKELSAKGVRIWEKNTSKRFLKLCGLEHLEEGDCGASYGFNFRHYGHKYKNCHTDYTGKGFDQIEYVLNLIRTNPHSRRIMISLWNPSQLRETVLPACHVLYQFYVHGSSDQYLSCSLYQRSGDMGLGVPFNIASASLMTYIFAKLTGKFPYELIHTIGDAHIYVPHIKKIECQLKRNSLSFPIVQINKEIKKIEDINFKDIDLIGYFPHKRISMKMIA